MDQFYVTYMTAWGEVTEVFDSAEDAEDFVRLLDLYAPTLH